MTEVEPELKNESLFSYKSSDISRIDVWREIFSEGNEDFKDRACGRNFICFKKIATVLIISSAPAIVNGNTVCLLFRGTRLMSPRPPGSSPHSFS